ncbi:hypothetical protein [Desulfonatronovibrio magnus]|uniref:hypothetical protein n=1 Tax=Desulfonatronovibrio magnus TaxID=698827 RepID=UPI0012FB3537|nr:hypothetical protein [Desulfonatronovibrio magnus]
MRLLSAIISVISGSDFCPRNKYQWDKTNKRNTYIRDKPWAASGGIDQMKDRMAL